MPDDSDVADYCDRCGGVLAWGSVVTTMKSSDGTDQVLCAACTEAAHRELWEGP